MEFSKLSILLSLTLAGLLCNRGSAASLVEDIFTASADRKDPPGGFCISGTNAFFANHTRGSGYELWKTDGTPEGTVLVKDIRPGSAGSYPSPIVANDGIVYFAAFTGSGQFLFRSDGSPDGTYALPDIRLEIANPEFEELTVFGGRVYFRAERNRGSYSEGKLWRTNAAGTGLELIESGSVVDPLDLTVVGDKLFFTGYSVTQGRELYVTTSSSTQASLVKAVASGSSSPSQLVASGDLLYFGADGGTPDTKGIWRSDGTAAGTIFFRQTVSGFNSLRAIGEKLYFVEGKRPWVSDGSLAGTFALSGFPADGTAYEMVKAGGQLYFNAQTEAEGSELWTVDGSVVRLVKDLVPGSESSYPYKFMSVGDYLLFATWGGEGYKLYRTDGSAEGTIALRDMYVFNSDRGSSPVLGDRLLFAGSSDGMQDDVGLWVSDGSVTGTTAIPEPGLGSGDSLPEKLVPFKGGVIFTADDGIHGREIWHAGADGSNATMLADIRQDGGSDPDHIVVAGDVVYFTADRGFEGRVAYKSDGTPGGTSPDLDFKNGSFNSLPSQWTVADDRLFFVCDDGISGPELWCRFGSEVAIVKDIWPGATGSFPSNLQAWNGEIFFTANHPDFGRQLWRSDGTAERTYAVTTPAMIPEGFNTEKIAVLGSAIYFMANDSTHNGELWRSDGTMEGTLLVKDVTTRSSPGVGKLVPAADKLFFVGSDAASGQELWVSDGTTEGTAMARDIYPGASSPLLSLLTTCGPDVFFYARDNGASGLELWKSDGTAAGTLQVKEIHPGTSNASITEIVAVEDRIYFTANDGVHGEELWTSDGSPEGTVVAFDGVPGSSGSTPAELVFTGNRLFFSAYTPATGSELFSMAEGRDLQISVESGPATIDPQGVIDFGAIVMGSSSPAVSLRFMNRGGRPFALEAIFPGGEDVAAFDVQAGSLPEELEPGEAMNVRVVFTPLGAGNATAHLTVTCGDFDAPERSVVLRGLGNRAPMFTGYSTLATSLPVVIREADVLDEASDPDEDVLGVANVSPSTPNHGTVMRGGGMIVYRPAPGFSGTDSFPVVIRDVHGATVDGLVSVIVPDGELENLQPDPLRLESISDGGRELVFRGIPGFTYTVQQSHSLTGWEDVAVVLADPNGVIRWTLPPVAAEAVFYRLVIP